MFLLNLNALKDRNPQQRLNFPANVLNTKTGINVQIKFEQKQLFSCT